MSDPIEQEIYDCWFRINNHAMSLSMLDNCNQKWYSLLDCVNWNNLLSNKTDWQSQMVSYYCRLTEYEPKDDQKQDYDELLKEIDQLVGLLND